MDGFSTKYSEFEGGKKNSIVHLHDFKVTLHFNEPGGTFSNSCMDSLMNTSSGVRGGQTTGPCEILLLSHRLSSTQTTTQTKNPGAVEPGATTDL